MNAARIYAAVALSLLLGVAVGGATVYFLGNGASYPSERQRATLDRQALLNGLAGGRILYLRSEDYQHDRTIPGIAHPPKRVLEEIWWRPQTSRHPELFVATLRDTDGHLLQHQLTTDETMTTIFVSGGGSVKADSNEVVSTELYHTLPSVEDFVEQTWEWRKRLEADPYFEFKGAGKLNGRASLIFWHSSDWGKSLYEFVEDAPLLSRASVYRVDNYGREALHYEHTVIDYRLLPAGSSVPRFH